MTDEAARAREHAAKLAEVLDLNALQPTRFEFTITNDVSSLPEGFIPRVGFMPTAEVSFEATLELDTEAFAKLSSAAAEPLYTVQYSMDLNPWHRKPNGARARLLKLRDCAWWTFRRRVLRRKLVESWSITVPNCRVSSHAR